MAWLYHKIFDTHKELTRDAALKKLPKVSLEKLVESKSLRAGDVLLVRSDAEVPGSDLHCHPQVSRGVAASCRVPCNKKVTLNGWTEIHVVLGGSVACELGSSRREIRPTPRRDSSISLSMAFRISSPRDSLARPNSKARTGFCGTVVGGPGRQVCGRSRRRSTISCVARAGSAAAATASSSRLVLVPQRLQHGRSAARRRRISARPQPQALGGGLLLGRC